MPGVEEASTWAVSAMLDYCASNPVIRGVKSGVYARRLPQNDASRRVRRRRRALRRRYFSFYHVGEFGPGTRAIAKLLL